VRVNITISRCLCQGRGEIFTCSFHQNLSLSSGENTLKHLPQKILNGKNFSKTLGAQVGPTYGRRMMNGYLRSIGIKAGERRIGVSLVDAQPSYNIERRQVLKHSFICNGILKTFVNISTIANR